MGRKIAKGEELLRFDVRANASSHLAFGAGVHLCLGAVRVLPRAPPPFGGDRVTGHTEYTAATFVAAPKRVPIRYRLQR